MVEDIWGQVESVLAIGEDEVGAVAMAIRTVIIYVFTLGIVRIGNKRFLGKSTAFDVILGIMLGSVMSRAITGSAPFFPTMVAGAVFVSLHWLLSYLAFKTDGFGSVVKGNPVLLIKEGDIQWDAMGRSLLTRRDLAEAQRLDGSEPDPSTIKTAYLERNGDISLIPFGGTPKVVDVAVENGVQTVRIELN